MKIIQIMPDFGLAGAETMCENLSLELVKADHDVTIISMYDYHSPITERLEKAGIKVFYLNKKIGLDFSMIPKMKKIFKEIKPDVIHTHRNCPQYAIPAAIMAGVKHRVHTVHNVADKENLKLARILNKFFFKHCNLIPVALSELIRNTIVEEYGLKNEQIPTIFNGINLSKCLPKENYSVSGSFKILHIGRFSEQKNHMGLVQGYKLFCEKYPNSELWLIGDGEKRKEIEEYIQNECPELNVKFFGLQSNVYGYLNEADTFILPSNYEGIPITLIEAMGTGLPIIASDVGGVSDMIDEGKEGLLIQPTQKDIANSLLMVANSESLRKNLGKNARQKSVLFSANKMAEEYIRVYSM